MGFETPVESDESRRALRSNVRMNAYLRDRTSPKFAIEVLDLSITGFRIATVHKLHVGDRVWIVLPKLSALEAKVVWRTEQEAGFAFIQPLHAAVFDHMLSLIA